MEITWRVISGAGGGGRREKVQGISSIHDRKKTDRERLRIVDTEFLLIKEKKEKKL